MRGLATLAVIVALLVGLPVAASAQPGTVGATGLQLTLGGTEPRVITSDGPGTLTLTGTLTNTGSTPVGNIGVRVQRSDPLRTEAAVREALAGDDAADAVTPQFTNLPTELAPGASVPVNLSVPLTGPPTTSLALTRTGVIALLVNVNASRDGIRARMAAVRTLLPVLSLPGGSPANRPAAATPFTLLYPLTDAPRRLPTVPGEQPTLTDDSLAASFGPGGRLSGLVDALAARAPVGSLLRSGICVAVDPDLLETASRMEEGYQVRAPDGTLTPGTGADAAKAWLARLQGVLRGGCVLALAQDDADLVALVRGGAADLAQRAVTDGRRIASEVLGTPVLADTVWPADGVLDETTLGQVAAARDGSSAVVLSADAVEDSSRTSGVVPVANPGAVGTSTTGVLSDPLLTLAATGPAASTASTSPAGGDGPLGTQDAIGTLAYRALTASPGSPAPLVLAPPHQWEANGQAADALLGAASRFVTDGLITPRALGASVAAGPAPDAPRRRLLYPVRLSAAEIPPEVVSALVASRDDVERLRAASDYETGVGAPPDQVFDPLLRGLLRGASAAWRGRPDVARMQQRLVSGRIGELVGSVRVLEPPGPFSLGTRDAPVPLTVANGLPITMTVRVELTSTAGLRVAPIPVQRVPPAGRVQVRVNTEVLRSGQFTVEAAVRTPDGGALGEPTRLQVRSTVYGTVTIWLTAVAGGLLILLAARRVIRRIRRERPVPAVPEPATTAVTRPSTPSDQPPNGHPPAPPNGVPDGSRPRSQARTPAADDGTAPRASRRGISSGQHDLP
ncbi:DUF6049 family protein [Pseudonocardia ailaonensis]|uniref:DUF6049 family protein n=1 Tax=Pseudonocardia ailaonensis TaxID=367279 RepID=A0ABN2N8T3_9PSEU